MVATAADTAQVQPVTAAEGQALNLGALVLSQPQAEPILEAEQAALLRPVPDHRTEQAKQAAQAS